MDNNPSIKRGLKDIYIDTTKSSYIDGNAGRLFYRGYDIDELANNSTFEETAFLLMYGNLPNKEELENFESELKQARRLPDNIIEIINHIQSSHPMDVLRTCISALSAFDIDVDDNSRESNLRKGIRLTAQAPAIVAAHDRIRKGQKVISPDDNLSHASNFLYTLLGEIPDEEDGKLLDKDFLLHAEHGLNASSFGARVTASTQSDLHSAVTTGVGILKGPSHGGAAESVMKMAMEIGEPENTQDYINDLLNNRGRVMGYGHRVYKSIDPRAIHLRDDAKKLGERKQQTKWYSILESIADLMVPYSKKGICQNVDFFSGAIYYLMGISEDLYTSIFTMGRIPGWTAQVMEQFEKNILIRPRLFYDGLLDIKYIPINNRD
ncbi:MAG: citrate (Si)-synthase [Chloroflexi bacterium]|nr:citrate (Si)-synthase [Chloroflexota bacterium]